MNLCFWVTPTLPGDVLLLMEPGSTYLVWVWFWEFSHSEGTSFAVGNIKCTVPFIVVDASPAPVIN